ncbi:MAG: hypothetical protein AAB511_00795 [Patescibacteria group bacterium]
MNPNEEKLITGTESETLLPPNNSSTKSAKEFMATTPAHELGNVFGATPGSQVWKPEAATVAPKTWSAPEKETTKFVPVKPLTVMPASEPANKPKRSILKIIRNIFFTVLIILVGLYIWGAILAR